MKMIITAIFAALLSTSALAGDQPYERKNYRTAEAYCASYTGMARAMIDGLLYSRSIGNSVVESHKLALDVVEDMTPTFRGISTVAYARNLADAMMAMAYDLPKAYVRGANNDHLMGTVKDSVENMVYPQCIKGFRNEGY